MKLRVILKLIELFYCFILINVYYYIWIKSKYLYKRDNSRIQL